MSVGEGFGVVFWVMARRLGPRLHGAGVWAPLGREAWSSAPMGPRHFHCLPETEITADGSLGNHMFLRAGIFIFTHKPFLDKISSKPSRGCCYLVAKSCPILCSPMEFSLPGSSVLHYVLEFVQTHVHWVGDAIQPSHPLPLSPFAFNLSQHQDLFQWAGSLLAKYWSFSNSPSSEEWGACKRNIEDTPLDMKSTSMLRAHDILWGELRVFPFFPSTSCINCTKVLQKLRIQDGRHM